MKLCFCSATAPTPALLEAYAAAAEFHPALYRYSMLKIALGAEFNSEQMFKDVAALASKYKGVQLHTHVAENPVSAHTLLFFEPWPCMTAKV